MLVSSTKLASDAIPSSILVIKEIEEGGLVKIVEVGVSGCCTEMWGRWKLSRCSRYNFWSVVVIILAQSIGCLSLNDEGLALMDFQLKVEHDPHGVFNSWNPNNDDPCSWWGVYCISGKVEMLNLNGLSLGGALASELGRLSYMKSLVLSNNNFSGTIPKEFGDLTQLELLDLRSNNLSGKIPEEVIALPSLKQLWICNNRLEDDIPAHLKYTTRFSIQCEGDSPLSRFKYRKTLPRHTYNDLNNIKSLSDPYLVENEDNELRVNNLRRRLLQESRNLPALPAKDVPIAEFVDVPSIGSGSFPAISSKVNESSPLTAPSADADPPTTQQDTLQAPADSTKMSNGGGVWMYILIGLTMLLLLALVAAMLLKRRKHTEGTVNPWKTGISGQLQKALVAGVPKLNRGELEAACEDFSNIIESHPDCTVYKGTLSSGVEIAVVSTVISSSKDWSEQSAALFHKKIDLLSRVNHKNFVNLLGYCEEDEPFMRMMVFEYAPNGTLFEHIHVKELEHLDWSVRMRIIMGIAYCLQYMHHELNPPVALSNVESSAVLLTDDYAAKIMEMDFWKEFNSVTKSKDDESSKKETQLADCPSNVYSFGILMLEVISGKPQYTKENGSIISWAAELLKEKQNVNSIVDPMLQSIKNNELDVVYQAIQECVNADPKSRPTIKSVTAKLREVLGITPESATPRLSPLWWAELEILSVEAS